MTTPTPDTYTPGVCCECHRAAPVLMPDGSGMDDGVGRCKPCFDALMAYMADPLGSDGPSAWYPGVEADHPDWY